MQSGPIHMYEKASVSSVTDDRLPTVIASFQRRTIPDDEERALCSGQSDIHPSCVLQKTDGAEIRAGSNAGKNDDVLLLTLETIDCIEAGQVSCLLDLGRK